MLRYVIDINLCRMMRHNFKLIITTIILIDNKVSLYPRCLLHLRVHHRKTVRLNVVFSREVLKLSRFFSRFILIEIYLLKLKMKRKYEIKFVSKKDEHVILSNDEISFIFTSIVLHFQTQCELWLKTKPSFFYYNLGFEAMKILY